VQHYRALMGRVCVLAKSPAATIKYLSSFLAIVNAHRGAHVFPVLDK